MGLSSAVRTKIACSKVYYMPVAIVTTRRRHASCAILNYQISHSGYLFTVGKVQLG